MLGAGFAEEHFVAGKLRAARHRDVKDGVAERVVKADATERAVEVAAIAK